MQVVLLVLYQLTDGLSHRGMADFIPGSNFYSMHGKFFKNLNDIGSRGLNTLSSMLEHMFSSPLSRIAAARTFNQEEFITKNGIEEKE